MTWVNSSMFMHLVTSQRSALRPSRNLLVNMLSLFKPKWQHRHSLKHNYLPLLSFLTFDHTIWQLVTSPSLEYTSPYTPTSKSEHSIQALSPTNSQSDASAHVMWLTRFHLSTLSFNTCKLTLTVTSTNQRLISVSREEVEANQISRWWSRDTAGWSRDTASVGVSESEPSVYKGLYNG